jgi:hypothetical protein
MTKESSFTVRFEWPYYKRWTSPLATFDIYTGKMIKPYHAYDLHLLTKIFLTLDNEHQDVGWMDVRTVNRYWFGKDFIECPKEEEYLKEDDLQNSLDEFVFNVETAIKNFRTDIPREDYEMYSIRRVTDYVDSKSVLKYKEYET